MSSSAFRRRGAPAAPYSLSPGLPAEPPTSTSGAPMASGQDDSPYIDHDAKVYEIHYHEKTKTRKRRNIGIFLLGSLFGIVAAGFFAKDNDLLDFPVTKDLSMDRLSDVLPPGLVGDMRGLIKGERDILDSYDAFSVGLKVRNEGLEVHHPMILIPGVTSTGLESWGTSNISRQYFRKRLWGSWSMIAALIMDRENWKAHIILDKETGLDPPNIKLRAAQGFDATDFFVAGYWIWNKIFENMASLGYDPTNSFTAAYDWRLSYPNLEVRDQYFTRLKTYVEMAYVLSRRKVVLTSHSMGSKVLFYFFHWVASPLGGNGGDDWVEKHVDAWINISGCMLGAVKDIAAILSGEMRDTAQLNAFAVNSLEKFLSKEERAEVFRSMPGISSLLPVGGEAVWGNFTWAPDDLPGQSFTYGKFISFRAGVGGNYTAPPNNMTAANAMDFLFNTTEPWYRNMVNRTYSQGVAKTQREVKQNEKDPRKWANPLESRLPLAPSLKIYCFYGVGKPTERAYWYRLPDQPGLTKLNITIDTGHTLGEVDHGVVMGEGDGTVSLLSMGYMCNKGWKIKRYNPAGVKVKVFEMPHEPGKFDMRGGPNTADHVDILGSQKLNELILRVAAGRGYDIEDHVVSNIREYSERVKIYEEGEPEME